MWENAVQFDGEIVHLGKGQPAVLTQPVTKQVVTFLQEEKKMQERFNQFKSVNYNNGPSINLLELS